MKYSRGIHFFANLSLVHSMQSKSRAKRRPTNHCKKSLQQYVEAQTTKENIRLREAGVLGFIRPRRTVYMDGVFDLFHIGHLAAIEQCAKLGDRVIIGITGDQDALGYKRRPIINEMERTSIVKSLRLVDEVVCPCPLLVTKEFMSQWGIDLVVHGFADQKDRDKQVDQFFRVAVEEGKFKEIDYYSKLSTTDIIRRIQSTSNDAVDTKQQPFNINPNWFGAALAAATGYSPNIPYDPFPLQLRTSIEQHLVKARDKQDAALSAVRCNTGPNGKFLSCFIVIVLLLQPNDSETNPIRHLSEKVYQGVLSEFKRLYAQEASFTYNVEERKLRETFLHGCGLSSTDFELSRLHLSAHNKDQLLFHLARDRLHFQETYDEFVRGVCIPYLARGENESPDEWYYQSFPCIRIVKPGEFSIGPHGDASYGHHPCSINIYVPLTKIEGSASLFLESRPGSEDWHPIEGGYGMAKKFAGAICKHWTPENHGNFTRVSLDFRIIPGNMFHLLKCGGLQPGGVRDVYRQKEGYYTRCFKLESKEQTIWEREGPLQAPDARFGFPWTKVKVTM